MEMTKHPPAHQCHTLPPTEKSSIEKIRRDSPRFELIGTELKDLVFNGQLNEITLVGEQFRGLQRRFLKKSNPGAYLFQLYRYKSLDQLDNKRLGYLPPQKYFGKS